MFNACRATLLLIALGGVTLPAAAGWYQSEVGAVSIFIPDHWMVEVVDDYEISASTQDESVVLGMRVFESQDLAAAIASLDQEILTQVADYQLVNSQQLTLNGMSAVGGEATGLINGMPVEIGLLGVATPSNHALLIFGVGLPEAVAQYRGDLDSIFQSIAPLVDPTVVAIEPEIWVDENCEWAEVNGTVGYVAAAGDAGLLTIFSESGDYLIELPQGFPQCDY